MKTLIPKSIKIAGENPMDTIRKVIGESLEKYNNIRDGIMLLFKRDESMTPIKIYEVANILDFISMSEYQNVVIDFIAHRLDGKEYKKEINFDNYKGYYQGVKFEETWLKILDILEQEKVKAIELSRIAAEIRTSAMENFISAVDNFINTYIPKEETKE